jgi:hypothetical protein
MNIIKRGSSVPTLPPRCAVPTLPPRSARVPTNAEGEHDTNPDGYDPLDLYEPIPGWAEMSRPQIVDRGWTRKVIRRFLGEPDFTRGPKRMPFYDRKRVEAAEKTEAFETWARYQSARRKRLFRSYGVKVTVQRRSPDA